MNMIFPSTTVFVPNMTVLGHIWHYLFPIWPTLFLICQYFPTLLLNLPHLSPYLFPIWPYFSPLWNICQQYDLTCPQYDNICLQNYPISPNYLFWLYYSLDKIPHPLKVCHPINFYKCWFGIVLNNLFTPPLAQILK